MRRMQLWIGLASLALLVWAAAALAGSPCCEHCGCHQKLKRICKLVAVFEEVDLPQYQCEPTAVFKPHKGQLYYHQKRCETRCELTKKTCTGHVGCCCEKCVECRTDVGAKPTGCHDICNVRQPAGNCRVCVPQLKWITIYVCDECCEHGCTGH